MNKLKLSNPVRLIAFFLTACILVLTFGFTADGWQIEDPPQNDGENKPPINGGQGGEADGGGNTEGETPSEPEIYIPEFTNRLTGLECDELAAGKLHYALVVNPEIPLYGISGADIICELPTEDGTRMIAFVNELTNLWKIGSFTGTRGYISNLVKYYGGISIAYGCDDSIYYTKCDLAGQNIDLSLGGKHCYTEFTENVYTNHDLLEGAIREAAINGEGLMTHPLPYNFVDFGEEAVLYDLEAADKIIIPFDKGIRTELLYNSESHKYTLTKEGEKILDAANGISPEFTNCFVLFADSITYDNAECSQMVMDTIGQGRGYYFTAGGVTEINWVGSEEGTLTFYTADGERLIANRGRTYISFIKSSKTDSLSFQ